MTPFCKPTFVCLLDMKENVNVSIKGIFVISGSREAFLVDLSDEDILSLHLVCHNNFWMRLQHDT